MEEKVEFFCKMKLVVSYFETEYCKVGINFTA